MSYKVVFISNFLSPHQLPICKQFFEQLDGSFLFIATKSINEERLKLGYKDLNQEPYVLRAYESKENDKQAIATAIDAEVVIIGSASDKYIIKRLKQKKMTFKYSERLLKKDLTVFHYLRYVLGTWLHHGRFMKYPLYLLCAGAFVSKDFNRLGYYKSRCYKWGYFPVTKEYENIDTLIERKEKNSILWAGRMIDWKHPEYVIELAKKLKDNNKDFKLKLIGIGEKEDELRQLVIENNLLSNVQFLGSMSPEEVRLNMERSEIFVITSNRYEGWGAVVNEAMNSGCVVVSSDVVGAAPWLLKNESGVLFEDGNVDDLYLKIKLLLENPDGCKIMAKKAYQNIVSLWNEKIAVERLIGLIETLKDNKKMDYSDGPCSLMVYSKE